MDDLISRQAAIDVLNELARDSFTIKDTFQIYLDALKDADLKIRQVPTAEPRTGKWEIDVDCEYDIFDIAGERTWAVKATCSECGFAMRFIEGRGVFNYCPNCGSRNTEESDE